MEASKSEDEVELHPITNDASNEQSSTTSYQELIVSSIGEMGRWQYFLVLAIALPKFLICWSLVSVSFTLGKTDWWKETVAMDPKSMVDVFFATFTASF